MHLNPSAVCPVLAALCVFCVAPVLQAQPADPSNEPANDTPPRRGELHVLVFSGATPIPGVRVRSPRSETHAITGDDGAVYLSVVPGDDAPFLDIPAGVLAKHPEARTIRLAPITVAEGASVEAIVTLDEIGEVKSMYVEGSGKAVATAPDTNDAQPAADAVKGTIRGRVLARESKKPIANAKVFVRGAPIEAETDADGRFTLELPEGTYGLAVLHSDFSTESANDVVVKGKQTAELQLQLDAASTASYEFTVTAPHIEGGIAALLDERRESSNVSDVIGAEEMSRTGDSDAAGALKRVTGITVVGGKYVYVRGMGERYSATLLNGQMIPSPEPERRVVPLDLFPTDVLESVVIQKTFSPDSPGEFGGGVVQLRTRSYPEKFTMSVSASVGYNSQTTFREGPTHTGGDRDWLGTDDGSRELPTAIRDASPIRAGDMFTEGYSDEDRANFARMLSNNYAVRNAVIPPSRGLTVGIGDTFRIGGVPIGFTLSLMYDDDYSLTEKLSKRYVKSDAAEGGVQERNSFNVTSFERVVSTGGIFVAGSEYLKGHTIKSTTLLLRITDLSTDLVSGRDAEEFEVRSARLRFVERQLLTQQITGEQKITDWLQLDWRYAYSTADRDEPDRREYFYRKEAVVGLPDAYQLSGRPDGNQRVWSTLDDTIHDFGGDVTFRFKPWSDLEASVKAGGSKLSRNREVDTTRLTLNGSLPDEVRRQEPNEVFSEKYIGGENGWLLEDVTQGADAYTAEQDLNAAYAMTEIPVLKSLTVMAGVRMEKNQQRVDTFDPFSPDEKVGAELDDTDWLPATTVTWRFADDMSVRAGYGKTLSRPDFRELSEAPFFDVTTGTRYRGNPALERATIDNYDVRWEWYFSTDELLSLGAFYKQFEQPIEMVLPGGTEISVTWSNAKAATNFGLELEGRSRLGFADESLENFYAATNIAIIRSNVDLGDEAKASTSKSRPLQGQSPYVINAQLGFDDTEDDGLGLQAALLYNVFGSRISEVGRLGLPDVYERPAHQVDFVFSQKLGYGLRLKLKAQNLLDPPVKLEQGAKIVQEYRRGRDFSLGLNWSY